MSIPDISVIGTGGLGSALTRALTNKNIAIKSIFNRTKPKVRQLAESQKISIWDEFPASLEQLAPLTFITVSDSAIEEIARKLSVLNGDFSGRIFVHCSGHESAELLKPIKKHGGNIACFHPLQTFTAFSVPEDFEEIYFSLQGDKEAYPVLKEIAQKLGAYCLEVSEQQKARLHLSATMASNYLTTLVNSALKVGEGDGISRQDIKQSLLPLVRTSLDNIEKQPPEEALTGAIKRGDVSTIEKHLHLLETLPELKELYCVLGLHTVEMLTSSEKNELKNLNKIRNLAQIPSGKVSTYGAIAKFLGVQSGARMVGYALNNAVESELPAHRVVNRNGELTGRSHFPDNTMRERLQQENVSFVDDYQVDIEQHFWNPEESVKYNE